MTLLAIALPAIAIVTAGLVGSTRRLGFWLTLLISIVLTPIGGFIAAWLSGPKPYRERLRHG